MLFLYSIAVKLIIDNNISQDSVPFGSPILEFCNGQNSQILGVKIEIEAN